MLSRTRFALLCGLLLLASFACRQADTDTTPQEKADPVVLAVAPTQNAKLVYSVFSRTTITTINKDPQEMQRRRQLGQESEMMETTSRLEMEATAAGADGNWSLLHRLTAERYHMVSPPRRDEGEQEAPANNIFGFLFTATFTKDGRLVRVPGDAKPLVEVTSAINPALLVPTVLLSPKPVRVGESWPLELTWSLPDREPHKRRVENLKGTGTLKSVRDNQAVIEFEYTIDAQRFDKPLMTDKIRSSATYDLRQGRFLGNQLEVTSESIGWAFSDNDSDIKTIYNSTVKVEAKP